MSSVRDHGDQSFLTTLQRLQPASITELCAAVGVTPTAVRQRLQRLESQGLVDRREQRRDQGQLRGRPSHAYSLTESGRRVLGDDHAEVAALLWREIMRIEDATVRAQVLEGVKDSLVERFGAEVESSTLAGRMQRMCHQLSKHGFDLEIEPANGLPILREHHCPYHEIVATDPSFCDLETEVFSALLGVSVERLAWRERGHRCCEFQVVVPKCDSVQELSGGGVAVADLPAAERRDAFRTDASTMLTDRKTAPVWVASLRSGGRADTNS